MIEHAAELFAQPTSAVKPPKRTAWKRQAWLRFGRIGSQTSSRWALAHAFSWLRLMRGGDGNRREFRQHPDTHRVLAEPNSRQQGDRDTACLR